MKNRKAVSALALSLCVFLTGCPMTDTEDTPITTADLGAAGAISILSSAVSFGLASSPVGREGNASDRLEGFTEFLIPSADATVTSCGRLAASDVCTNKAKSASYANCFTGLNGTTYSGMVSLAYSDTSCALPLNALVTRTSSIDRVTSNKSVVHTTSDSHVDYRGNTLAGGSSVSRTNSGFNLTITGVHKTRTSSKGTSIYDVSVRTLSPITITDPSTTNIIVNGGSLEVAHNNARYVATLTPSNLFYNYATCCYPRSGTLTAVYSGAITGTAMITFSSTCGEATLSIPGGDTATITMVGCD